MGSSMRNQHLAEQLVNVDVLVGGRSGYERPAGRDHWGAGGAVQRLTLCHGARGPLRRRQLLQGGRIGGCDVAETLWGMKRCLFAEVV